MRWRAHVLRIIGAIASVWLVAHESPMWWVAAIPWAILCVFGILATLPLVLLMGAGIGAAQADWMSDPFIVCIAFVLPTLLSIAIAEIWRLLHRRAQRLQAEMGSKE